LGGLFMLKTICAYRLEVLRRNDDLTELYGTLISGRPDTEILKFVNSASAPTQAFRSHQIRRVSTSFRLCLHISQQNDVQMLRHIFQGPANGKSDSNKKASFNESNADIARIHGINAAMVAYAATIVRTMLYLLSHPLYLSLSLQFAFTISGQNKLVSAPPAHSTTFNYVNFYNTIRMAASATETKRDFDAALAYYNQ